MAGSVRSPSKPTGQEGFALVVAILLLLILTVFSLFATNVGVFEQRTSANEYRAKAVAQVADAALNHGSESVRVLDRCVEPCVPIGPRGGEPVNNPSWPAPLWQLCDGADTTFPCGAEADPARRALTYRYVGGVDLDGRNGISVYEQRSVNFPPILDPDTGAVKDSRLFVDSIASSDPANPFPVEYQVGLLLCRVDATTVGPGTPGCTTALGNTSENRAYTLVARARMTGEQASATFTKTIVPIQDIALNPKVPSVVASGMMTIVGTPTVIPNPNSGGFGVPISVWSRTDVDTEGGTWQSCHYDDWLRTSDEKELVDGVTVCRRPSGCNCANYISGGGPGEPEEGIDILDVDGDRGTLKDTKEFPCDLMEFLWGPAAKARSDLDGDGFCEEATETVVKNGITQSKRAVAFLETAGFKVLADCNELGPTSAGKYWSQSPCTLPGREIGSPANPVQIVVDGVIDGSTKMKVFGIVFGRDPKYKTIVGGEAQFRAGSGVAEVYGALVIEGGGKMNANQTIIYDAKTLQGNNQDYNPNVASVPGSWSDRVSY